VWPVLIVVDLVRPQDPPQMGLVPDERAVRELAPGILRSSVRRPRFIRGVRMLQGTGRMPASARTVPDAAVTSGPRPRIMNVT
jgi:hypothetical protein